MGISSFKSFKIYEKEAVTEDKLTADIKKWTKENIDVNDLSSFKINDIDEYEAQTERFDFDSFDDKFYEDENLHQQIIDYARKHVEQLIVE